MATGARKMAKIRQHVPKKEVTPTPSEERVVIAHMKGSAAYAAWLEAVHQKTHIPKAALLRLGMVEWALKNGYPAPPDR